MSADVDECAGDKHNCSTHETCVDTDGGYRCVCTLSVERGGCQQSGTLIA